MAVVLGSLACLSSCTQNLYYQHSGHAASSPYRAIPLQSENRKSAYYAAVSYTGGEANAYLSDRNSSFTASSHSAWNLKYVQGFAATDLSFGNYNVNRIDSFLNGITAVFPNRSKIQTGVKGYGAWNIHLGVNMVIPFASGGEWRVLGVEYFRSQDWGPYSRFRNELPDSAVNIIHRSPILQNFAFSTELVFKLKEGNVGYKFCLGAKLGSLEKIDENGRPGKLWPGNLAQTVQLTKKRFTGYLQFNSGYRAYSFMIGTQFRLR